MAAVTATVNATHSLYPELSQVTSVDNVLFCLPGDYQMRLYQSSFFYVNFLAANFAYSPNSRFITSVRPEKRNTVANFAKQKPTDSWSQ